MPTFTLYTRTEEKPITGTSLKIDKKGAVLLVGSLVVSSFVLFVTVKRLTGI